MTVTEFSNEFDIHYNSIASNGAPALDLYEKSVYLTKAQLELIKNYFNPNGNKYREGFEGSSKRRVDLRQLVKPATSTLKFESNSGLSEDSQFFIISQDVFIIVQETAKVSGDPCIEGKYLNVVPKLHDEYNLQKDNPFKQSNSKRVWRIDVENIQSGNKNVELISPYTISEYKYRYVEYPTPIILGNLSTLFPGEGLSIDGKTSTQTSQLDQSIHREIVDRAVELALADYKPQGLSAKAQLSTRNE